MISSGGFVCKNSPTKKPENKKNRAAVRIFRPFDGHLTISAFGASYRLHQGNAVLLGSIKRGPFLPCRRFVTRRNVAQLWGFPLRKRDGLPLRLEEPVFPLCPFLPYYPPRVIRMLGRADFHSQSAGKVTVVQQGALVQQQLSRKFQAGALSQLRYACGLHQF